MESRQPEGDEREARRRLLRLAAETRPRAEHLTRPQLEDWARTVLDRIGGPYGDQHVTQLVPILERVAAAARVRGRARRRAWPRTGRWQGR